MEHTFVAVYIIPDTAGDAVFEILSALLDKHGFEGIFEGETGLIAYIEANKFEPMVLQSINSTLKTMGFSMQWKTEIIPEQNWNALWESNFEPVIIVNRCVIRAPFHETFGDFPLRITIEPKMSFGTGHHQTTRLMIEKMLQLDFRGRKVLDMGCGTGVLGILASLLGAIQVCCVDTDPWACENTLENCSLNLVSNIRVIRGDKEDIPDGKFDIVMANINRNVLIDQMSTYAGVVGKNGMLLMSGFLDEDLRSIELQAEKSGFIKEYSGTDEKWTLMLCKRI
jgi:ribosomal protein L11 methyltransferase